MISCLHCYFLYCLHMEPISGHIPKKAGSEGSELGFYRKKLIDFLQGSTYYRPEELLPRFPMNGKIVYYLWIRNNKKML